jgi:3',5'-cyclic AMP phosphodiesterase CpdA
MWQHIASLRDQPDLILHGGDIIFSSFEKTRERSQQQWDLYLQSMRAHNKLPVYHCLGNHDIWGWNKAKSATTGTEATWGKKWAMDELGLGGAYYAFEQSGVKFIVLDSVQPSGEDGYAGGLDDPQFEWLQGELKGALQAASARQDKALTAAGAKKAAPWLLNKSLTYTFQYMSFELQQSDDKKLVREEK